MATAIDDDMRHTGPVRPFRLRAVPNPEPSPAERANALMVNVASGDERAFAELYDELAPLLYGVIQRTVRDPSMSDEITQEVFVEIWRNAPKFDISKGGVRGWATTIAHRRAVDRVRSEEARRRREDRDHHQRLVDVTTDLVGETVTGDLDRTLVREALGNLPDTQRDAITLAYFGGKTYREVAALLEIPEGTAKTRIRNGLIRLRDTMGLTQ